VDTYTSYYSPVNTQLLLADGPHNITVTAKDTTGATQTSSTNITVTGQSTTTFSDLQNLPGWQTCADNFPSNSPRVIYDAKALSNVCAAGNGQPASSLTQHQATPSLDGKAAHFTMGGPTPYSNQLYYYSLGGGSNPTHFVYDFYFYIDKPDLPQALEFDLNQTFGNNRWTWGTECNLRGYFPDPGAWDVWDGLNEKWIKTNVPCTPFPANTWNHIIWTFERVGNQMHYVSLQINDQKYNLDLYYTNQPGWTINDINVAFQMDGNFAQQPYNTYLDKVTLIAQ
jgi:hypothetical protein